MILTCAIIFSAVVDVASADEFMQLAGSGADTINLIADIDFNGVAFIPQKFQGTFNGNNHTLKNIVIIEADLDGDVYLGVFSNICGNTVINDLSVQNVEIRYTNYGDSFSQHTYLGCLAGNAGDAEITNVTIRNCWIIAAGNMNARHVGGLFGSVGVLSASWVNLVNTSAILRHMGDLSQNGFSAGGIAGRVGSANANLVSVEFKFQTNAEYVQVNVGGVFGKQLNDVHIDGAHIVLNVSAPASRAMLVGGVVGKKANESALVGSNIRNSIELTMSGQVIPGGLVGQETDGVVGTNVLTVLQTELDNIDVMPTPYDLSAGCTACFLAGIETSSGTYKRFTPDLVAEYPVEMWSDKDSDSLPDVVVQRETKAAYESPLKPCGCGPNALCPEYLLGHITINWCECPDGFLNLTASCYPAGCFTAVDAVCGGMIEKCSLTDGLCHESKNKGGKLWLIIVIALLAAALLSFLTWLIAHLKKKSDEKKRKALKGNKASRTVPGLRALKSPANKNPSGQFSNSSGSRLNSQLGSRPGTRGGSKLGSRLGNGSRLDDVGDNAAFGGKFAGQNQAGSNIIAQTTKIGESTGRISAVGGGKYATGQTELKNPLKLTSPGIVSGSLHIDDLQKQNGSGDSLAGELGDQQNVLQPMGHESNGAVGLTGHAVKKVKRVKKSAAEMDAAGLIPMLGSNTAGLKQMTKMQSTLDLEAAMEGPALGDQELGVTPMPYDNTTAGQPSRVKKTKVKKVKAHQQAPDAIRDDAHDVKHMANEGGAGKSAAERRNSQAGQNDGDSFLTGPTLLSGEALAIDQLDREFGSMLRELNPRGSLRGRPGGELTETRQTTLKPVKMSYKGHDNY